MSTDSIVGAMAGMAQDRTQVALQAAMMRQNVEAVQQLTDMLASFTQAAPATSAPAPGTGLVVDKRA